MSSRASSALFLGFGSSLRLPLGIPCNARVVALTKSSGSPLTNSSSSIRISIGFIEIIETFVGERFAGNLDGDTGLPSGIAPPETTHELKFSCTEPPDPTAEVVARRYDERCLLSWMWTVGLLQFGIEHSERTS